MNDRPATIAFGDDHDHGSGGFENLGEGGEFLDHEEEEIEAAPTTRRKSEAKKSSNKAPAWIFLVGGGIILAGVLGGSLMVFSKMKQRAAVEEESVSMSAPVYTPQPVIQMANPQPGVPQVIPEPQAVGVGAQGASAPIQSSVVQSNIAPVPTPPVAVAPEKSPEKNLDSAKLAAIEEGLSKVLGQIDDMKTRIAKLESTANKPEAKTPAKAVPPLAHPVEKAAEKGKNTASEAATAEKPEKAPAPVKQAVAPKPAAKPLPAKSQEPKSVDKTKQADDSKPAAASAGVQGYSVSSLIGTRAWLVKLNSDGTETELSVSPGERVEGKLVTSVDGASKSVVLEGGQRITVHK